MQAWLNAAFLIEGHSLLRTSMALCISTLLARKLRCLNVAILMGIHQKPHFGESTQLEFQVYFQKRKQNAQEYFLTQVFGKSGLEKLYLHITECRIVLALTVISTYLYTAEKHNGQRVGASQSETLN